MKFKLRYKALCYTSYP